MSERTLEQKAKALQTACLALKEARVVGEHLGVKFDDPAQLDIATAMVETICNLLMARGVFTMDEFIDEYAGSVAERAMTVVDTYVAQQDEKDQR